METTLPAGNTAEVNDVSPVDQQVHNEPQPQPNEVSPGSKQGQHWCKPKMTTSLSKETQAVIQELAPGNVVNITQFIGWLLKENASLQQEIKVYDENQQDLNKKIQERDTTIDRLEKELEDLCDQLQDAGMKNAQPVDQEFKADVPKPAPAAKTERKPVDFMTLLGF